MSDTSQLSFKRAEISLSKFNDVAVPYHLDLLKKHMINIQKSMRISDWQKVQNEKVNATRVVKQLKQLLYEVDLLRNQICDDDIVKFDRCTAKSRERTLKAIEEYLTLIPVIKNSIPPPPIENDDVSNEEDGDISGEGVQEIQLSADINNSYKELKQQEEYAKSFEELQNEVSGLHELFLEFEAAVQQQKEQVDIVETNVLESHNNVEAAERTLSRVSKMSGGLYPVAGALLGSCIGGPIGLIAGVKLGGLVAMSCGILGFTGGRLLHKRQKVLDELQHKQK